jgi:hypothetical protein
MAAYTHVFSSALTNELRFSEMRRKFIESRPFGDNMAAQIGLTGVSGAAFPAFTIPGYGVPAGLVSGNVTIPTTGAALGNPTTIGRVQTPIVDLQFLDGVSWYRGQHALKFGAEYRRGANDETRDRGSAGNFTISPQITDLPGSASTTGNAFASFLLGEVNAASIQISDKIRSRASYLGLYLQDDWRFSDRLTINAGLRWETEFPRYVLGNKMNSFDPFAINPVSGTPGVVTFAGVNGTPIRAFKTDWNNFGPRLGFAYRIPGDHETVIRGGAGIFYSTTISNSVGDLASAGFSTSASFSVGSAEKQSVFHLRDGFPAVTRQPLTAAFGAVPLGQKPNTSIGFFKADQAAPISYQYNLGIQHELSRNLLVEIGYIGNVSHNLTANDLNLNQVAPELLGTNSNPQLLRPFPQFNNVTWINPSIGNSSYHGGFIRAEKRMGGGVSFLAHYTFSKFLDDVEAANEFGTTGSYMDVYHRNLDKARSGSDVPQRIIGELLYELPPFKSSALVKHILGGWKVGLMETAESGPTFTVITTANTTGAFPAGPLRPNLIHNPELSGQRTPTRWFDTSAFANPALFTFGNSPRSGLRGAPVITTDATLEKTVSIGEGLKFNIRGEFYNLLNHAIFNIPGFTLGAADFGTVSSARSPRTVQISARLKF